MLYEAIAAALVALAVLAVLVGPLTGPGGAAQLGTDEPEDPEDTPKGIALAALREIEFDRATGKLSDEDYEELKAKYTVEALAVLRDILEHVLTARRTTLLLMQRAEIDGLAPELLVDGAAARLGGGPVHDRQHAGKLGAAHHRRFRARPGAGSTAADCARS